MNAERPASQLTYNKWMAEHLLFIEQGPKALTPARRGSAKGTSPREPAWRAAYKSLARCANTSRTGRVSGST